jgi:hypothetical protein
LDIVAISSAAVTPYCLAYFAANARKLADQRHFGNSTRAECKRLHFASM